MRLSNTVWSTLQLYRLMQSFYEVGPHLELWVYCWGKGTEYRLVAVLLRIEIDRRRLFATTKASIILAPPTNSPTAFHPKIIPPISSPYISGPHHHHHPIEENLLCPHWSDILAFLASTDGSQPVAQLLPPIFQSKRRSEHWREASIQHAQIWTNDWRRSCATFHRQTIIALLLT